MITNQSVQQNLFAASHRPNNTSVAALKAIQPKVSGRKQQILSELESAGYYGLIRHELSVTLGVPLSSICSLVRILLDEKLIQENGLTRTSPYGQQAKVLILANVAGVSK